MSYESATILFRHGKDDFAVWEVELPEPLLRKARHARNTATGDLGFILDQLSIQESRVKGVAQNEKRGRIIASASR